MLYAVQSASEANQDREDPMTTCACGNCQFFDNQSEAAHEQKDDDGLCRFNPPQAHNGHDHAVWPVVERKDWCGHFAATVERFMTPAAA
jgi:hypothetical protein